MLSCIIGIVLRSVTVVNHGARTMVTMKYLGGQYDGEVTFDETDPASWTPEQKRAAEHYEITDDGMTGRFVAVGSPSSRGARTGLYEVVAKDIKNDKTGGHTVYLRSRT